MRPERWFFANLPQFNFLLFNSCNVNHRSTQILTTPTKPYNLRSRLAPLSSPEHLNEGEDGGEDIWCEQPPSEMTEMALTEELQQVQVHIVRQRLLGNLKEKNFTSIWRCLQEQASHVQTQLNEEAMKNSRLVQQITKLEEQISVLQLQCDRKDEVCISFMLSDVFFYCCTEWCACNSTFPMQLLSTERANTSKEQHDLQETVSKLQQSLQSEQQVAEGNSGQSVEKWKWSQIHKFFFAYLLAETVVFFTPNWFEELLSQGTIDWRAQCIRLLSVVVYSVLEQWNIIVRRRLSNINPFKSVTMIISCIPHANRSSYWSRHHYLEAHLVWESWKLCHCSSAHTNLGLTILVFAPFFSAQNGNPWPPRGAAVIWQGAHRNQDGAESEPERAAEGDGPTLQQSDEHAASTRQSPVSTRGVY